MLIFREKSRNGLQLPMLMCTGRGRMDSEAYRAILSLACLTKKTTASTVAEQEVVGRGGFEEQNFHVAIWKGEEHR